MVHVEIQRCPHCRAEIDVRILGVCSRLGPSRQMCYRCGQVCFTDRREWRFMTISARLRYGFWSLMYIMVGATLGGGYFQWSVQLIGVGFRQGWMVDFSEPPFWIGFGTGFIVVGLVQVLRVAASIRRVRGCQDETEEPPYGAPTVLRHGWHLPVIVLLAIPLFVCGIVALLRELVR